MHTVPKLIRQWNCVEQSWALAWIWEIMDQCYIVHALLRTSIQCILNLRTRPERMNGELTWMEEDILKLWLWRCKRMKYVWLFTMQEQGTSGVPAEDLLRRFIIFFERFLLFWSWSDVCIRSFGWTDDGGENRCRCKISGRNRWVWNMSTSPESWRRLYEW